MRFVYMDEAGISASEPVTIVVGLVIDADKQLMQAETSLNEALKSVPDKFSDGFIFHAKDIWGNKSYRDDWQMSDRLAFLKNIMSLPRRLNIPIAYGLVRRGFDWGEETTANINKAGLKMEQFDHIVSFGGCVARADKYIREHAEITEIASIVAEDIPEMRRFLKVAPDAYRGTGRTSPEDHLRPTLAEQRQGFIAQETEMRISRIRKGIHFVAKQDDPILQLADACAFALRRYFSEQDFGNDFIKAMLGFEPILEDFAGPSSYGCYTHVRK